MVLTYSIDPYGAPVTPEKVQRTVELYRRRLSQLGKAGTVHASGGRLIVTVGRPVTASLGEGGTAQLYFYEWEPNVIGPTGQPAPTEPTVTVGGNAGASQFGLPEYQAILRAAKRPPILRANDTTWSTGCTSAQVNDCLYGSWYLIAAHEKVLCPGNKNTCPPAETEANLYADNYKPPAGVAAKALRVNPGTVLVRARPVENAQGKVTNRSPNSFYVLNDNPVLSGADITHPQQGFQEGNGGKGLPNVNFGFTPHGKTVFEKVTRAIAHRGQEAQLPGISKEASIQHFAVALDGELITTPSIDYTKYPEGIDATNGSEITGGFTITSAHELAEELAAATLPVRLTLRARSG